MQPDQDGHIYVIYYIDYRSVPVFWEKKKIHRLNPFAVFFSRANGPQSQCTGCVWLRGEGGIQLPNISHYNLTCLMRHACDWISDRSLYSNTALELAAAYPWSFLALLHTPPGRLPGPLKANILFRDTVVAWREGKNLSYPLICLDITWSLIILCSGRIWTMRHSRYGQRGVDVFWASVS